MSEKIDVTPNVKRCLEVLREAVKTLPEGDLKTQAEGALEYLESAARGEPQPNEGRSCPIGKVFIPLGG
ncbi:MAG: hypothetical protein OEY25_10360 [Candidatus Aminicenantes bacterium]|nr:hypothetical protein [Candidatus Aminicenantes bacterium]MDH5467810.1 hypothetical protein [Candidatus Aminicenantes bacterium]